MNAELLNTLTAAEKHTSYYDIKFDIVLPKNAEKQNIRLIINLEAQNKFHNGYDLLTRAVYYGSRLISAQYGTVFENEDYGKIEILENEFEIPFTSNMKEGVGNMCNISYGFYEQGIAQGIEQGIVKGKTLGALQSTVENIKALMESLHLSFEEAVRILKIPAEQAEIYKTHIQ